MRRELGLRRTYAADVRTPMTGPPPLRERKCPNPGRDLSRLGTLTGVTDSSLEKKPAEGKPVTAAPDAASVRASEAASVRASDADRDRFADILREALATGRLDAEEHGERLDSVYAAKTMGELEPLVRDLPEGRPEQLASQAAPQPEPVDRPTPRGSWATREDDKDNLVAIFSGSVRKGQYRVPEKINATAVFGGVEIDLTDALFEHPYVVLNTTAVFGGISIRVPKNVTLRQKGAGVFGGFEVHTTESPDPDAPVVLVQGAAVFGGVEARPRHGKWLSDAADR